MASGDSTSLSGGFLVSVRSGHGYLPLIIPIIPSEETAENIVIALRAGLSRAKPIASLRLDWDSGIFRFGPRHVCEHAPQVLKYFGQKNGRD